MSGREYLERIEARERILRRAFLSPYISYPSVIMQQNIPIYVDPKYFEKKDTQNSITISLKSKKNPSVTLLERNISFISSPEELQYNGPVYDIEISFLQTEKKIQPEKRSETVFCKDPYEKLPPVMDITTIQDKENVTEKEKETVVKQFLDQITTEKFINSYMSKNQPFQHKPINYINNYRAEYIEQLRAYVFLNLIYMLSDKKGYRKYAFGDLLKFVEKATIKYPDWYDAIKKRDDSFDALEKAWNDGLKKIKDTELQLLEINTSKRPIYPSKISYFLVVHEAEDEQHCSLVKRFNYLPEIPYEDRIKM